MDKTLEELSNNELIERAKLINDPSRATPISTSTFRVLVNVLISRLEDSQ